MRDRMEFVTWPENDRGNDAYLRGRADACHEMLADVLAAIDRVTPCYYGNQTDECRCSWCQHRRLVRKELFRA